MSTAYRDYRVRAFLLPLGVLAYVCIAILGRPANHVELYPFFNWNLFSDAQSPMLRAELEVRSIDGVPLETPQTFYHMADTFADAANRDTRLAKAVKRLANAIDTNDDATRDSLLRVIESRHLREVHHAEYDIVVVTFDPITRYTTGETINRQVIGSFVK